MSCLLLRTYVSTYVRGVKHTSTRRVEARQGVVRGQPSESGPTWSQRKKRRRRANQAVRAAEQALAEAEAEAEVVELRAQVLKLEEEEEEEEEEGLQAEWAGKHVRTSRLSYYVRTYLVWRGFYISSVGAWLHCCRRTAQHMRTAMRGHIFMTSCKRLRQRGCQGRGHGDETGVAGPPGGRVAGLAAGRGLGGLERGGGCGERSIGSRQQQRSCLVVRPAVTTASARRACTYVRM